MQAQFIDEKNSLWEDWLAYFKQKGIEVIPRSHKAASIEILYSQSAHGAGPPA